MIDTQTGYGRKRGDGSEQANQQPCDPVTKQYTDGSTASSSPSKETSSIPNEQPPHSDGGKPDSEKAELVAKSEKWAEERIDDPRWYDDDETEEMFKQHGKERVAKAFRDVYVSPPDWLKPVFNWLFNKENWWIRVIENADDSPCSCFGTILSFHFNDILCDNEERPFKNVLAHEMGHLIDFKIGMFCSEHSGGAASMDVTFYGDNNLRSIASSELDNDQIRNDFKEFYSNLLASITDDLMKEGKTPAEEIKERASSIAYSKTVGLHDLLCCVPDDPRRRGHDGAIVEGLGAHDTDFCFSNRKCATEIFANLCEIACFQPEAMKFLEEHAKETLFAFDRCIDTLFMYIDDDDED